MRTLRLSSGSNHIHPLRINYQKLLFVLIFGLFCSGCTQTSKDMWQDYSMRLENTFSISIESLNSNTQPPPALPNKRDRQTQLNPPKINLLDFLKLYKCEVNTLIAKRNSPLGKVMLPSQYFIYAMTFIDQAQICINQEGISPENKSKLQTAIRFYQQHRLELFHNAVFHNEWDKAFHGHKGRSLENPYPPSGIAALNDLNTIKHQLTQQKAIDTNDLEQNLKELTESRYPGNWIKDLMEAIQFLKQINNSMEKAKPVCPLGQPSRQSDIMQNVFRKYFSQIIQPWISQLHRFGQSFDNQLNLISSSNEAMSAYHHHLFIGSKGPWKDFQFTWRQHVQLWQKHLKTCRLMPKSLV